MITDIGIFMLGGIVGVVFTGVTAMMAGIPTMNIDRRDRYRIVTTRDGSLEPQWRLWFVPWWDIVRIPYEIQYRQVSKGLQYQCQLAIVVHIQQRRLVRAAGRVIERGATDYFVKYEEEQKREAARQAN